MGNEENLSADAAGSLLAEVYHIIKKHDEIARITGEGFNVFEVLNVQKKELRHTMIIAELLNPEGAHGKGGEFLMMFLDNLNKWITSEKMNKIGVEPQSFGCARVEREKGKEGKEEGDSQVDILVTGDNAQIVIENKIESSDGDNQIEKYRGHYGKDAWIIYLTKYGNPPKKYEAVDRDERLICISYERYIIVWLKQCKEKSVGFPYLLETIAQYINLLKNLTEQSRSKEMTDDILGTILKSPEKVEAALSIPNSDTIKKRIVYENLIPAMKKLAENNNKKVVLEFNSDSKDSLLKPYWGFSFINKLLQDNEMAIKFQFDKEDCQSLIYGFCMNAKEKGGERKIKNLLRKYMEDKPFSNGDGKCWAFYKDFPDRQKYSGAKVFADLVREKSEIIATCKEKLEELLDMLNDFEKTQNKG